MDDEQTASTEVRQGVGCALATVSFNIIALIGGALHLLTAIIAYQASGLFAALVTFFLPVLAEIYWLFKVWSKTGTLSNFYCLCILGYIALWVLGIIGMWMANSER